jgi:molybdopterin-synthase adenylyltransferase
MPTIPQRALIVGCGGLGCPAALALAQAGVAFLTLVDSDVVELSNLQRQPWHHAADVGRLKVESAASKIRSQFPNITVEKVAARLDRSNGAQLFSSHDVIVDGTDDISTKFFLSALSVTTGVPLIHAGVLRFEGLVMRIEPGGPCLQCLFEEVPDEALTCAQAGVLGSVAGLVGGLQALAALQPNEVRGEAFLSVIDAMSFSIRRVKVKKRKECNTCGSG